MGSLGIGYVDDVGLLVSGATVEECLNKIKIIYPICRRWAARHASIFDPDKFQLVHFTPTSHPDLTPLDLGDAVHEAKSHVKYLGVFMDWRLHFNIHINEMEGKTNGKIAVLAALGGSAWGIGLKDLRMVYISTVLPLFTYCASVWFTPSGGYGTKEREKKALRFMRGVQKRCAKIISGAFKTVSGEALDIEWFLMPVQHALENAMNDVMLRTVTSPVFDRLQVMRTDNAIPARGWMTKCRNLSVAYAKLSPLERLQRRFEAIHNVRLADLEPHKPYINPPWWKPLPSSSLMMRNRRSESTIESPTKNPPTTLPSIQTAVASAVKSAHRRFE